MTTLVTLAWIIIAPLMAGGLTSSQIVIWLTLIPYLFLPEAFAVPLPGLPDIDKTVAVSLGLLISIVLHRDKFAEVSRMKPAFKAPNVVILTCLAMMLGGAVLTLLTNREPLFYGPTVIPGLRLWDFVALMSSIFFFIIPFFVAVRYLPTADAQRELLAALVVTGLVYSCLMLVEIRLSPQMHNWVYGYHQHSFLQHIRDGFRPKVFLQHGIWVGFFMVMAVMAALGLWKATKSQKWLFAALWLFLVLGISKNLGATAICILCAGLFVFTGRRIQMAFAAAVAVVVLLYPVARQQQLIPIDRILSAASAISEERAGSLQFRIDNEDELLAHADRKLLFGWGLYARDQIFDEAGRRVSVSEGRWIQTIGRFGWTGYIALFGLLTFPVVFLWLKKNRIKPPPETCAVALIITGNLIYMIPNSTLTPVGWLMFGSLAGYLRYAGAAESGQQTAPQDRPAASHRQQIGYTRFHHKARRDRG